MMKNNDLGSQVVYRGTNAQKMQELMRSGFDPAEADLGAYGHGLYCTLDPFSAREFAEAAATPEHRAVVVKITLKSDASVWDLGLVETAKVWRTYQLDKIVEDPDAHLTMRGYGIQVICNQDEGPRVVLLDPACMQSIVLMDVPVPTPDTALTGRPTPPVQQRPRI